MARLDYLNARTGARRARLLGAGGVRDLLLRPSLAARVEWLAAAGKLAAGAPRELPQLRAAEWGLRARLRVDEAEALADAEGRRAREQLAAALGLAEGAALKVVLRGVATGTPAERVEALAEATGGIAPERARALAASASPEALAVTLAAEGSPYGPPLSAALAGRERIGLLPAELAVDRVAHAMLARAASGRGEDAAVLGDWAARRVDLRNGATLLAAGEAAAGFFLEGGRKLGSASFARLARSGAAARRSGVALALGLDPGPLADGPAADRELERAAARELHRMARRAPLSLAVPLAWIEARREEVRRIALLLRATELGMAGEEILALVEA